MAKELANLVVGVRMDAKQLKQGMNKLAGQMRQAGEKLKSAGRKMALGFSVPIAAGFGLAIREALNLEGQLDKFDSVFKEFSGGMREFVDDIANRGFPAARSELIKSAASLQDLIVPMGVNRERAADMTKQWLELAGQLAAFNDVPMERALEAISSGLAGMSRPLRRFGIDARKTAVQAEAVAQGLIKQGEEMDTTTRLAALLSLAQKQSADAIAGFEDQLGSARIMMESLKASTKDFLAQIGKILLPIFKDAVSSIKGFVDRLSELDQKALRTGISFAIVTAAIGPAMIALGTFAVVVGSLLPIVTSTGIALVGMARASMSLSGVLPGLASGIKTSASAMKAFTVSALPITATILGIIAVVGALATVAVIVQQNWQKFRIFFRDLWKGIKDTVGPIVSAIGSAIGGAMDFAVKGLAKGFSMFFRLLQKLVGAVRDIANSIDDQFGAIPDSLRFHLSDISVQLGMASNRWQTIGREGMAGLGKAVNEGGKEVVNQMGQQMRGVGEASKESWDMIKESWKGFLGDIVGQVATIMPGAADEVKAAGDDIIAKQEEMAKQAERMADKTQKSLEGLGDGVKKTSDEIGDKIPEALSRGERAVRSFRSGVARSFESLTRSSFESADSISEAFSIMADNADQLLGEVVEAAIRAAAIAGLGQAAGGIVGGPVGALAGGVFAQSFSDTPGPIESQGQFMRFAPGDVVVASRTPEGVREQIGTGGGDTINQTINVQVPAGSDTIEAAILRAAPIIKQSAEAGIIEKLERGGDASRTVRKTI